MHTNVTEKLLEDVDYEFLNSADFHRIKRNEKAIPRYSRKFCERHSYSKSKPYPIAVRVY